MLVFAHHMAVELFGREFSPHGTLEHVCVFGALGLFLGLAAFGAWTIAARVLEGFRSRRGA